MANQKSIDRIVECLFLGTGTSTGIPMPACFCSVCHSPDSYDKRLRTSVLLTTHLQKKILVDTSPDLRWQLLKYNIHWLDAVIITHDHADHLHGIDDLRALTFTRPQELGPLPIYTYPSCAQALRQRFPYIFETQKHFKNQKPLGGGIPNLKLVEIGPQVILEQEVLASSILDIPFHFFLLPHGHVYTLGFFQGHLAYCIDCNQVPDSIVHFLAQQPELHLVIDCLQRHAHKTHLTVQQCFETIKKIRPKRAYPTHINHDLSHRQLVLMAQQFFTPNHLGENEEENPITVSFDGQLMHLPQLPA